jgi:subtilisin family serine protease
MVRMLTLVATGIVLLGNTAGAAVVSRDARMRARAEGAAPVVVLLRAPEPATEARAAANRRAAIARVRARVLGALAPADVELEHAYVTVPGFSARATPQGLARLAADPDVLRVDLDPVGTVAEESGALHVRADRVQARGVSGVGTTIAIIDTGVEADHPDIADALVHEECFCRAGQLGGQQRPSCCPDGSAHQSGPGAAMSVDSHGPHVAGIALSRGRLAPTGVAPGALLVSVRVLDSDNQGFISDWIAALDWIAAERPDVRVINMSLVSGVTYAGDCGRACGDAPGCAANMMLADVIEQLWNRGTLLFAASGNSRRTDQMSSPACVAPTVSVGAVDAGDDVASFSNADRELDLLAPGVDIISDELGPGQGVMSGTSMASPHAAGTAALVLSAHPGLSADAVEAILKSSGVAVRDARTLRTTPRIDAFAAFHAAIQGAELERGSGSRATDCLLEWSFVPPEIVERRGWPLALCHDNDPSCDADQQLGRCTFIYSPCFNMRDPLLRSCRVDEPLLSFAVTSPPVEARDGSIDRMNVDYLASALPDFPFTGSDTCADGIPFIVTRPRSDAPGIAHLRMSVATATRRDYDHLILECLPP